MYRGERAARVERSSHICDTSAPALAVKYDIALTGASFNEELTDPLESLANIYKRVSQPKQITPTHVLIWYVRGKRHDCGRRHGNNQGGYHGHYQRGKLKQCSFRMGVPKHGSICLQ